MIDMLVAKYLIVIPIILILVLLVLTLRKVEDKERNKFIITIFSTLLFLLLNLFLTPDKDPDYLQKNVPYLEIKLVIENSDSEGFNFYYLIKNTGQLPAENINFTFISPSVKGTEFEPSGRRILSPNGGEMKYTPHPLKTDFKVLKSFNRFTLIISFETKINDETKYFVSTYKNIIPSNVRNGAYTYDECTIEEKKLESDDKIGLMEFEKIEEGLSRYPGISFNMLVKLNSSKDIREKYIWDIGSNYDKKRLSIYLNEFDLVFRVISESGDVKLVKVDANPMIDKLVYLNLEVGRKNENSFMRIGCNGKWLVKDDINFDASFVEDSSFFKWSSLGADISGKNGGIFHILEIFIYPATLTSLLFGKIQTYFADKYKTGSTGSIYFNGNSRMYVKDPNNPLRR